MSNIFSLVRNDLFREILELEVGVDLNGKNKEGVNPLHLAMKNLITATENLAIKVRILYYIFKN
jgi:hypothetical protein